MEAADEERTLLPHPPPQHDRDSEYTLDGSVDINGRRALKRSTGRWRACFLILGTKFCECMAFFGIGKNLVTYLTGVLHESNAAAARNVSAWIGTCFLTPVVGAFLADTLWGRYRTIIVFLSIYTVGMLVLTVSASALHGGVRHAAFYVGLYLAALGTGGIKPCTSPFGADQFDVTDPAEQASKGSFFNWYFFSMNVGSVLSGTVLVWVQDNVGWGVGLSIPTVVMVCGLAAFVTGSRVYRFRTLSGESPLVRLTQVVVAAVKKCDMHLPDDSSLLYELPCANHIEHTNQFRFLDKAAIVVKTSDGKPASPWRQCTVTQVEELKMLVRTVPIWATLALFFTVSSQMSSTFIEQGMAMDNRVGPFAVPTASLSTLNVVTVLVLVPLYDAVLVPLARSVTGRERGFTQLQRLGVGLALAVLSMVSAALVETRRLELVREHGLVHWKSPAPMSILWQSPQYFLHGAAEVFTTIGMLEFFYDQSPDAMKSLCSAVAQLAVAAGSYLNSFLLGAVAWATARGSAPGWIPDNLNEGHLDYFFWVMAALCGLNVAQFVYFSSRFRGKTTSC